ncbi:hypothetical protein VNO77_14878 [Canavalia gladiata]|uniref:Uncharacterized protein n=1 Tax=Canavalia gladiata TaxID=3824 RepID=A0AAN9LZ31_CANGL
MATLHVVESLHHRETSMAFSSSLKVNGQDFRTATALRSSPTPCHCSLNDFTGSDLFGFAMSARCILRVDQALDALLHHAFTIFVYIHQVRYESKLLLLDLFVYQVPLSSYATNRNLVQSNRMPLDQN